MKALKIILVILLFLCLLDMPYGYYQFVRFVSFAVFGYLAYQAHQKGNKTEAFVFVALALLFQPFVKIALGRTLWNLVDVVVGIGLVLSVFFEPVKKNK
ncbi:MAG: hypothetical protein CMP05_08760 [Xanthomarina sp.]|uniref:DUF6804 family protein n=1 Tax=Xanthomarina TaxID=1868329 RepID=UPI000C6063BA|nr:DUF6804 family protein [Xanthomarina sp.]MAL22069.1 hypothetical protein [Xanthomarina sp.]MBF62075.1 hypothetical protein [Xanthomarina sp.]HAB26938.1 hypothetical protein [Xanthomarina gelatinilytica]HAI18618.1 hypothetical protein [Xanthomarina gelatinilytica]|tara:strand:+ start:2356 stop:2652 length:297 start_codon:yes stop_codon:yes gene_type:complete